MALAHDADSSFGASGLNPSSPVSWNHTCTGSNLILIVGFNPLGGSATAITYNGVSMTNVRADANGASVQSSIWILVNPATGTHSISVSFSGTPSAVSGGAVSLTGAKQSGQPDAQNGGSNTFTNPSTSVTTVADNCWVVDNLAWSNGTVATKGGSQTQAWQLSDAFSFSRDAGSYQGPKTPAGSVTMSWTASNITWAQSVISIAPFVASSFTWQQLTPAGQEIPRELFNRTEVVGY